MANRFDPLPGESKREKQWRFVRMLRALTQHADTMGYQLTLGDGYRDPRTHGEIGEKKGYGHINSCHKHRLAQDYNLFLGGQWMDKTTDFEPLGIFWEGLATDARWGGRFGEMRDSAGKITKVGFDGNHFSLEHEGHQ